MIQRISRSAVDALLPHHSALEALVPEEVEWFANRRANVLGLIARETGTAGWNYVILKRDRNGKFRVRQVMGNFFSLRAARVDLLLAMAELGKAERFHLHDPANERVVPFPTAPAPLVA